MRKVDPKLSKTLIVIALLLTLSYLLPCGFSQNYSFAYQFLDRPDGSTYYRLNVTVPQSLYEYYLGKSHTVRSTSDFAKFVTPFALKPIADSLLEIYNDDENFVNGVLMLVHQIPYEVTIPPKYPVETIVENKGDCDLFSFIAASIIKVRGLDCVLLHYENEKHMNIGVNLQHAPRDVRGEAFYVTHNHNRYYIAECTGSDWQTGWRVGECPEDLRYASAQIITLENYEEISAGQVSASLNALAVSALTLATSAILVIQGSTVMLSGQLSPKLQDKNITIYVKVNNLRWMVLDTITTDSNGLFDYAWHVGVGGLCYVRASWSGDDNYAVADSPTVIITSLSVFFILLLVTTLILIAVGTIIYSMGKQAQRDIYVPQLPEILYRQKKAFS